MLVARHGKIVCNRSYGKIDFDSSVPVTENTLFGLASVSKASGTLSGIMKLYDDGKFKLDEPASKYIAGLRKTDKKNIENALLEMGKNINIRGEELTLEEFARLSDILTQ